MFSYLAPLTLKPTVNSPPNALSLISVTPFDSPKKCIAMAEATAPVPQDRVSFSTPRS